MRYSKRTKTLIDIRQHNYFYYTRLHVSTFQTVILRPPNRLTKQILCTWNPTCTQHLLTQSGRRPEDDRLKFRNE